MVSKSYWRFQLGRVRRLLGLLLGNKMAAVGLFILVTSTFVAIAGPSLSPYSPTVQVTGAYAQPEWVTLFPDGYYLSKNLVVVNDPSFTSPAAAQAWQTTASPSTLSNLETSYAPNVSPTASGGSLKIGYAGNGTTKALVSRTFHYPYHGPPERFQASLSVLPTGATAAQPVGVRVFIQLIGGLTTNLWNTSLTASGKWVEPSYQMDSSGTTLNFILGTSGSSYTLAQIQFSAIGDYVFGVELTFNGAQQVNLGNFQLSLLGTAWGVFGSDNRGVDLFTQVIYGARISLLVGLSASAIGIGLGLMIGLLAGFLGSLVDEVLMRFTDMMLTIPLLPLFLVLVTVLGASIYNIIIIIGFFAWMGFARIIRSQVLTLKERPFIEASRAAGAGTMRTLFKHIFPNIVGLTYVNLALTVPGAILSEAALAFLGLFDPSVISWGHILANAEETGSLFLWWWVIPPGLSIAIVSLSFVLIGYALDEIFNPKLRRRQ